MIKKFKNTIYISSILLIALITINTQSPSVNPTPLRCDDPPIDIFQ